MKKLLGNLLFFINLLCANEYFFETKIDKNRYYVNEPILLNVSFFKNENLNYTNSKFNPKIDNFEVKLLQEKVTKENEFFVTNYKYLLTPLIEGNFTLNLQANVEDVIVASLDANTLGRDNLTYAQDVNKNLKTIDLTPLNIEVLPNNQLFVGDIKVETKIDTTKTIANNPINFELIISFNGNIEKLQEFNLTIENVKIFNDKVKKEFYFDDKLRGVIKQKFALVSDLSFNIPKIEFKYLNPISNQIETAFSDEIKIEIQPNEQILKKLLDEPKNEFSFKYLIDGLTYLFFIIFGFILCKLIKLPKKKVKKPQIYEEIEKSKNAKELLKILFKYQQNREILKIIERIEKIAYSKSKESLEKIKKDLIKTMSNPPKES